MIFEIFKKELHEQILTFRFMFGLLLCLVLFPLFAAIIGRDHQFRQEQYQSLVRENDRNLSQVMVYANIRPIIYRPPAKLSFLCRGLDEQMPSAAQVSLVGIDIPPKTGGLGSWSVWVRDYSLQSDEWDEDEQKWLERVDPSKGLPFSVNPLSNDLGLMAVFPGFDLTFLATFIFSLLAIIFGFNAISAERETGSLRMVLSGRCSRFQLLVGKIAAGLAGLCIIIVAALLLGILTFVWLYDVRFELNDWLALLLVVAATILMAFIFFNTGVLFSVLFRRSSISLISALVIWVILTICYPTFIGWLAERYMPVSNEERLISSAKELLSEIRIKARELEPVIDAQMPRRPADLYNAQSDAQDPFGYFHFLLNGYAAHQSIISNPLIEPIWIEMGDRMLQIQEDYYRKLIRDLGLYSVFSWPNPVTVYENLVSRLAGTDELAFLHYFSNAKQYRRLIIDYLHGKDAFASLRYSVATDLSLAELPVTKDDYYKFAAKYYDLERRVLTKRQPPIPDAPRFDCGPIPFADRLTGSVSRLIKLAVMNVLLMLAALAIMNKSTLN